MSLFSGPCWFNIPAHRPFVDDLARGLHEALSPLGPDALSQAVVLVPTRRAVRALTEAFLAAGEGRAVLPPQMRPLGDLEQGEPPFEPGDLALDLAPAIEPLKRRFELMSLVQTLDAYVPGGVATPAAALELGDALGALLDGLAIEEVEIIDQLAGLVDGELAEHWQVSRRFLEEALRLWPARLDALGVSDVSARRVTLLRKLAEQWTDAPPQGVLVAAGSTGTAPATRALLRAVAAAPQGCVVLPGLDSHLAEKAWAKVDAQHPQGALKVLLEEGGIAKGDVAIWPASRAADMAGHWRRRIINEALRPAEETADWLRVIDDLKSQGGEAVVAEGLAHLSLVSARDEAETATVAALLLREALERPDRTAALVTPDQGLARRVSAILARWGVIPDSSAGVALAGEACGVLAGLVAKAAADPLSPVNLMALLKHPFSRLGDPSTLEPAALRGARPVDWTALSARLQPADDAKPERIAELHSASALAERLEAVLAPLLAEALSPAAWARRLAEVMESVAADDVGDTGALWAGPAGDAVSRLLAGLIRDAAAFPPVSARQFADLFQRLIDGETVRAGAGAHPRIRILGAIEARLVRADRLILAGLEEGVWPAGAALDPFLSRPMRKALGLPSPERRIGLAAHDFAQAACAPEVVLLHSERREGSPSVKSRWLWRLETLARGADVALPGRPDATAWARSLDAAGPYQPWPRPVPTPPVADRPRSLFVTRVEALTRDPYAVWARDILKLRVWRRPDEAVDVRVRGTAIHEAFEGFLIAHPTNLPPDAEAVFAGLYLTALAREGMPPEGLAREAALAAQAARWVVAMEEDRRADGRVIHVEQSGAITFATRGGPFTLSAKADRIEATPDGLGHVLDYKTGKAPSKEMVQTGFSPQLTLTAAILARGGFPKIGPLQPAELTYLEISGRDPPGRIEIRATPDGDGEKMLITADAAESALAGLIALIERYEDPKTGYASRTAPQFVHLYQSEYDHLARVFEWSTSGETEDE
ncbi:double-strand break repair protein AddB [Phenylobacterium immobile]|uniref:double-strand break repair protein AddB n=1 Tax=Phenylobacterium immobile TaxID=21 RepID=UPI000A4A8BF5|nr:double-strand break repair protein AddB [Phenylobacterium immobile]